MKTKYWLRTCTLLAILGVLATKAAAATPPNYPTVIITNSGGAAPGQWIGTLGGGGSDGSKAYYVILDNTGTNILSASTSNVLLRYVTPQGFATDATAEFRFKDENLEVVDRFTTMGYGLDSHDVKLLPNGHALLIGAEARTIDLSGAVPGGRVDAQATGAIIQELDAAKRLVFEWHSLDHIPVTDSFVNLTQQTLDYTHVNAVTIDPTDNNLLTSFRHTSEIVKIDRRTGEVLWRLGGKRNEFTFIYEHEENAPYYTVGQHDVHRLANGNLLYFDNGTMTATGTAPAPRTYSRVVEYALDEVNKVATLVWEYRHSPDILASCQGSVKRMANGNTIIDWGCASGLQAGTIVTEVNPAGEVVFEMTRRSGNGTALAGLRSNLTKQLWDSPDLIRSTIHPGIQEGRTYDSPAAGATVTVNQWPGATDAALVIQRHLDSVRFPTFAGRAPHVVMEHLMILASNGVPPDVRLDLDLDLPDTSYVFDTPMIHDPAQVVIYHRSTPGVGLFSPLPTTWYAGTQKLHVTSAQPGEFIFAYPAGAETPYTPVIRRPADQGVVSESQPVTLAWSPQGLVGAFEVQASTHADFSDPVLNLTDLGDNSTTMQAPLPGTEYFWRVRVINQGGASAWASASFRTAPPTLQITAPAGGEVWQRFQTVAIRWSANISESLAIDLYKGGVSNRTFTTAASGGLYVWTVGQFAAIPPGTDYTIKIRSTTNPAIFDFSEPFNIVQATTIATAPPGLRVTVDGTDYTSPATFAWAPGSPHVIGTASPQVAGSGQTRYRFGSWSDGGTQTHSITAPIAGITNTVSFSTEHLLDITVSPPGSAAVTAAPPGPWYAAGQVVSLSAQPDAAHLLYTWQGVETQSNTTAQLTMDAYHAVEAKLIPSSGVPAIWSDSVVSLPDRRMQFTFTAGAGLATQATVWGTTVLTPPSWRVLSAVSLTNGVGVYIDRSPPAAATRFYRVTLP